MAIYCRSFDFMRSGLIRKHRSPDRPSQAVFQQKKKA
jgi:hypothetical protein